MFEAEGVRCTNVFWLTIMATRIPKRSSDFIAICGLELATLARILHIRYAEVEMKKGKVNRRQNPTEYSQIADDVEVSLFGNALHTSLNSSIIKGG